MTPKLDQLDMFGGLPVAVETPTQFRLSRFQVFNWGTFSDLVDIAISEKGFLFVGPSGAGKSTLLDANSTLMTPPKWLSFNLAAREGESGGGQDRNLMTYVRGAWGQQTGKSGEAVQLYLRENTTWSALAQTYTNTNGRAVTIAQVFWVRGKTTDRKEVKRTYLVIDRAFDLRELQQFAEKDFDLKVLRAGAGVSVHDEFSAYRDRFSRLMGIEQESSLRLLHKTQSAKNLGDLNDFLRDFMLEPPETFDLANKLVGHFQALREAHASVVDTRRQIEVLQPAQDAAHELERERAALEALAETKADIDAFKEQRKDSFLASQIASTQADINSKARQAVALREVEDEARGRLNVLQAKRNGGESAQIVRCEAERDAAQSAVTVVAANQPLLTEVAAALDMPVPHDAASFEALAEEAAAYVAETDHRNDYNRERRDDLKAEHTQLAKERNKLMVEVAALGKRHSNIPAYLQEVRARICESLGIPDAELPFAGELVDVRDDAREWKGAAERVMRNFAENILVPEEHYVAVSRFINATHMGATVKYLRVRQALTPARVVPPSTTNLFSKLAFASHPLSDWLAARAKAQFDHECVASVVEFEEARRAVTREGLVKSDEVSHRKDDRYNINDQSKWIMGGDTAAKLGHLLDQADDMAEKLEALAGQIKALEPTSEGQGKLRQCEKLAEKDWVAFNLATVERRLEAAEEQLVMANTAVPDIEALDGQIEQEAEQHKRAQQAASTLEAQCETLKGALAAFELRRQQLNPALLSRELSDAVVAALTARFAEHTFALALDNLDQVASDVKESIAKEERAVQARATAQLHAMLNQFRDYMRDWPAKSAHLDASESSAPEFFEILDALAQDGLPQYEERFLTMLREQGTQEMMRLHTQLEQERKAIKERLEHVNESLSTAAFNAGTHLVIETKDKLLPDVMAFRQNLKEAYSNFMVDNSPAEIERRFGILNDIVTKLESADASAKAWREVCLDVRRHVDFIIRELDADGNEVEVYRSGAGKSGGQRQKLTATCLAAALRYQLGGKESGVPKFSTVFMDEAFDKADAEFTALAMNIFKTFGFQLVVATPMKSVMTMEPYIGGACIVHIQDRKYSNIVPVAYREEANKLDFGSAGVELAD